MTLVRQWVNRYWGRRSRLDPMVELQYQTMVGSAKATLQEEVLARPELVAARNDFRKIEAIEKELLNDTEDETVKTLLRPFLTGEDPWLKACAAKALYPIDPRTALDCLHSLLADDSHHRQLPAVWALGEVGTAHALEVLMPLVWHSQSEIQRAAIRSLVQLESKNKIPPAVFDKVTRLLAKLRSRTDWIL